MIFLLFCRYISSFHTIPDGCQPREFSFLVTFLSTRGIRSGSLVQPLSYSFWGIKTCPLSVFLQKSPFSGAKYQMKMWTFICCMFTVRKEKFGTWRLLSEQRSVKTTIFFTTLGFESSVFLKVPDNTLVLDRGFWRSLGNPAQQMLVCDCSWHWCLRTSKKKISRYVNKSQEPKVEIKKTLCAIIKPFSYEWRGPFTLYLPELLVKRVAGPQKHIMYFPSLPFPCSLLTKIFRQKGVLIS